jgi:hypothetical protein
MHGIPEQHSAEPSAHCWPEGMQSAALMMVPVAEQPLFAVVV